jgi:hypothetical protein
MKTITAAVLATLTLSLGACSDGGNEDPEGVIPGHMEQGMNKANDVEGMLQQAEQQRREDMDSQ